jgi:formylglycine-generating enzyme required for sulfatase activity
MGSPSNEEDRDGHEFQHLVRITRPFYMARTEITQGLWQTVMGGNPSRFRERQRPVEKVSWHEARRFTRALSIRLKRTFRLPTEAEWEFACRAGTTGPFTFGPTVSTSLVNYDGDYRYGHGSKGVDRNQTLPVGRFRANAFGLFDMHGNVREWCEDGYGYYFLRDSPTDDPLNAADRRGRMVRGGSYDDDPGDCRSAARKHRSEREHDSEIGFRIVLELQARDR